jgi:nitrous oxide reductase
MRRSLAASALLLASAAGCVIVDPSCGGGGGATILISPSVVVVAVGQSTRPKASWCRRGRYDDVSPTWSLGQAADANVIGLDPETGMITGKRAGQATVIATYAGAEGSRVQVTVR